jgi:hypothetical protein
MTRVATGDVVAVKAGPNVYTVLVIAATIATFLGLIAVIVKYNAIFGHNIWQ